MDIKKLHFTFIFLVFISFSAYAQEFNWVRTTATASGGGCYITSVADTFGNVYSTGFFSGSLDFNTGGNVSNLAASGANDNLFVSKTAPDGTLIWTKVIGHANGFFERG